MKKFVTVTMFALAMVSAPAAMAEAGGEGNNTGCNGVGNTNSPCTGGTGGTPNPTTTPPGVTSYIGGAGGLGGQGGAGGQGGTGLGVGVGVGFGQGGNATANGGNATIEKGAVSVGAGIGNFSPSAKADVDVNNTNKQGQMQGQQQSQSMVGNGNSTNVIGVSTKDTVGDVKATGGNAMGGSVFGSGNSTVNTKGTVGDVETGDNVNVNIYKEAEVPTETTQNVNYSGETTTNSNVNYSGSYEVKNVPDVSAPALTSSNDTCMGSTSGGVAVAGFGFSLGSTWSDKNCLMLKNSREMWNMGFKAAAMARMCMDELNKEALELTGFVCPTKKAE